MQVLCPSCGEKLGVPADAAGKQGRCPKCRQALLIPQIADEQAGVQRVDAVPQTAARTEAMPTPVVGPAPVPGRPGGGMGAGPVKPPPLPQRGAGRAPVDGHLEGAATIGATVAPYSAGPGAARGDLPGTDNLVGTSLLPGGGAALSIWRYRHEKEKLRFILAASFSGLVWLVLVFPLIVWAVFVLPISVGTILLAWATTQMYRARVLGSSVRVGADQFPDLYAAAREVSAKLGLQRVPDIFVVNSEGVVNAFAQRMLGGRFVFLNSALVDLMLHSGRLNELKVILAHELAHHAAGHISALRNWFLKPAMFLPFIGSAYRRACELTADRLALVVTGDLEAGERALAALASGSTTLMRQMNLRAMVRQEDDIPEVLGVLNQLYATHPRLTQRIVELERYSVRQAAGG